MTDLNSKRLLKVRQILRTMDCQHEMYSDSGIWVDGGLWHLFLPEDDPNAVYWGFIPGLGRDLIADVATRFVGDAVSRGLDVYYESNIPSDSTNPVAGWIEQINDK